MKKSFPIALLMSACSLTAFAGPYLSVSQSTVSSFHYTTAASGPSAAKTVVVQSAIMAVSSGNVSAAAPTDYEISLDNMSFGSTASIPFSGDTLAATTVYIRMKAGFPAGTHDGQMLSFTATGVSANVTLNGMVTAPCTVAGTTTGPTSATFSWNATGAASYECTVDLSPNAPAAAGTAVSGTTYTASGLTPATHYYMHVRGKGANNDYTDWTSYAFTTSSTGIGNVPDDGSGLSISPNPGSGIYTIKGHTEGGKLVTATVTDLSGKVVYTAVYPTAQADFSATLALPEHTPAGIYLLRMDASGHTMTGRIVLAR